MGGHFPRVAARQSGGLFLKRRKREEKEERFRKLQRMKRCVSSFASSWFTLQDEGRDAREMGEEGPSVVGV